MALKNSLLRAGKRLLTRFAPTWRARSLSGVVGRVHRNDVMLYDDSEESIANYLRAARSAIESLELALERAGRTFADVRSCLDFGCGHGRVLRALQQQIPARQITACDVDAEGVRFCAAEFGVTPIVSSWRIDAIRLGTYDLIWSGSVFTHLDAPSTRALFAKLGTALTPHGLLVFSIHGEYSLGGLDHLYGGQYAGETGRIRQEVATAGISFRPYDAGDFPAPYGMTWHSRTHFEELARDLFGDRLRLISWEPQGWDCHHDVLAFQRAS